MISEIKKLVGTDQLVIGTGEVTKLVKRSGLSKIWISSSCPVSTKADLERYASIAGIEVDLLDVSNEELGVVCRKPFSISVVGKKK